MIENKKIIIGNRSFMYENSVEDILEDVVLEFEKNGDTVVYMAWDKAVRAIFVISDVIRDNAYDVVNDIKEIGLNISIVSGDNKITTNSIALRVGIEDAISEASPVKKRDVVRDIQQRGQMAMMIGDGINDAPALTEAMVGVAMGRGTDIAMESADAVLIRSNLKSIPYLILLSKKTNGIIKQNIFWAFFYNIIAIPLAVAGVLHPIIAAGAMAASSLIVVINSLRITKIG